MRLPRTMTQPIQLNIVPRLPVAPVTAVEDASGEESGLADRSYCRVSAAPFPVLIPASRVCPAQDVLVRLARRCRVRQTAVCA